MENLEDWDTRKSQRMKLHLKISEDVSVLNEVFFFFFNSG